MLIQNAKPYILRIALIDSCKLCSSIYISIIFDVITFDSDSLHDPDRGFKAPMKDGLEFYIEHYPWKRLPAEVFSSLGGREAAKEVRLQNKLKEVEAEKSLPSQTVANESNNQTENSTEEKASTELKIDDNGINLSSKKRSLPETLDQDTSVSKMFVVNSVYSHVPQLKPIRRKLTDRKFVLPNFTWINLDTK